MIPFMVENYGNPSSIHKHGREVKASVENSRNKIAFDNLTPLYPDKQLKMEVEATKVGAVSKAQLTAFLDENI